MSTEKKEFLIQGKNIAQNVDFAITKSHEAGFIVDLFHANNQNNDDAHIESLEAINLDQALSRATNYLL